MAGSLGMRERDRGMLQLKKGVNWDIWQSFADIETVWRGAGGHSNPQCSVGLWSSPGHVFYLWEEQGQQAQQ